MSNLTEVTVPDIGNFDAVEIIEVNVAAGDTIEKDDALITLESDKAAMEIPSPDAGIVKELKVDVGDKVAKGDLILLLENADAVADATQAAEPAVQTPEAEPKAQTPEAAPKAQTPQPDEPATKTPKPTSREQKPAAAATHDTKQQPIYASPAMRRLAASLEIDIAQIKGTGKKGRITREDVSSFIKSQKAKDGGSALPSMPFVDFAQFGKIEAKPLNRIKKLTAEYMHRNWVNIPHVTQFDEVDITQLEAFRKACKPRAEKAGVKLTPLPFLMKAVVAALKSFPQFNASLSADKNELIYKKYFHIGVAVDTEVGLVVPVIRDVNQKGLFEIAREVKEQSEKAKAGKLTLEEMQGSCFTLSSLGGIGGTAFTPIINAPDVAILGISKAATKPVFIDDKFYPRLMCPLSLSYDHRVIDGAEAARFMVKLGSFLTDIRQLLL